MSDLSKEESIKGAFMGAIVADALCLGSHYEYDAQKTMRPMGISRLNDSCPRVK